MSLKDAVLEVASTMEREAESLKDAGNAPAVILLRSFARELRTAVKAAECVNGAVMPSSVVASPDYHRQQIEKAKEEMRKQASRETARMVEAQGGPMDGTMIPVNVDMPEGARTNIAGWTYLLRGGVLCYETPLEGVSLSCRNGVILGVIKEVGCDGK